MIRTVCAVLLASAAAGCVERRFTPLEFVMDFTWGGVLDEAGRMPEPSGVVLHPHTDTLFIVDDEGSIFELSTEDEILRSATLGPGLDLEGVTADPATGRLYVAVEKDEMILEVDPADLTVRRRFTVPREHHGQLLMDRAGNGLEGIVFLPDADHPEGGTLLVANQTYDLDNPTNRSVLVEVELPLRRGGEEDAVARIVRVREVHVIDMAGLHYDADRRRLYVACDSPNVLLILNRRLELQRTYALPGDNQEGLAADADGNLYIAQDSGGVLRIAWPPAAPPASRPSDDRP
jgi:uncharacterized protein YjiK